MDSSKDGLGLVLLLYAKVLNKITVYYFINIIGDKLLLNFGAKFQR